MFIVGMPRSGTTLTEQILASHPQVAAGGELKALWRIMQRAEKIAQQDDASRRQLEALNPETINAEAAEYLAALSRVSRTADRVTDKMPHNFQALGTIALMFPNARVIHCVRSPMDTCLSCYTHRFNEGHAYANDLATLGLYYREYARLMDYWRAVLPIRMLESRYEDLIADQEGASRRLIAFLDLEWDDACLDFHKTQGTVRTLSRLQVRQPLYGSSVAQWKRYEKHLGPLKEALGDLADA